MGKKDKIIFHVARTRKDLEDSFALVYDEYVGRGYIPKHYKSKLRISLHNSIPSTTTFIAREGKKVLATITLIADSPLGLPMDKIYKKECDALRRKGRRIAEVSQLSIDSKLFPKGWFSMFNFSKLTFVFKLFKIIFDYSHHVTKLDELCIAVNPKHQYLYKFIFFEEMGGLKHYGSVNKAPALAFHLSMDTNLKKKSMIRKGVHNIFYGKDTNRSVFAGKFKMDASDLEYFFARKSDIFKKASKEQLDCVQSYYKDVDIKTFIKKHA